MRDHKERRKAAGMPSASLEDNGRTVSLMDRRKRHERRIGNLGVDELQLMLSEMPSPTTKKPS